MAPKKREPKKREPKKREPRKRELRVPTPDQVEALLDTFSKAPTSVRNRALVTLLWKTGLRISEALALRVGDVDEARGRITVRDGKGGKARSGGLSARVAHDLRAWLALRDNPKRADFVFVTLDGDPLQASYVRTMFARKSQQAGLPRLHPHALRHAFASDLVREGFSVHAVQKALGHSSLQTTAVYLESIGEDEVAELVARRS